MTDCGLVRHTNEDALYINDTHQVYAVADGLGGLPGGAETSERIVELIAQTMNQVDSADERVDLSELATGINQIITQEGLEAHPFTGTGSTLTVAQIVGDQLLIAHVGDSAAYLMRNGELEKLTIDHTMAQELINREGESARDSMPPEFPHTLTRCIGQGDEISVDRTQISVDPGDCILLCTDGLNKVIDENQIRDELKKGDTPEAICRNLIREANAQEGSDNITVIILKIN
jgi:protein phosphatase